MLQSLLDRHVTLLEDLLGDKSFDVKVRTIVCIARCRPYTLSFLIVLCLTLGVVGLRA